MKPIATKHEERSNARALTPGSLITVNAYVQQVREFAWGGFVLLRLDDGFVQGVVDGASKLASVREGAAVRVEALVRPATIKSPHMLRRDVELSIQKLDLLSCPTEAPALDLNKSDLNLSLDVKFDARPISLRHPKERAVFRVAAAICHGFREYLRREDFTEIHSPKLCSAGAEGGANIFDLDYFGRRAFLAQSPQFYKQMGVGIYNRVFEVGPVFRAEKHATSRHLNEYISLDLEMGFVSSHEDVMRMEGGLLRHVIATVAESCAHEIGLLGASLPVVSDAIPALTLSEAHELVLQRSGKNHLGEPDLAPEEEEALWKISRDEFGSDFVFVTHYPRSKRPFYTKDDPDALDLTRSFDLLFRGVEITTGGQRIHDYDEQVRKMTEFGLNPADFESFLQIHRAGMPPHGGLAIGLERLTARLLGIVNVKEASLFPRDLNRLTP